MRIVFDGPPGPEAGRFVEVEDDKGNSINAGTWHQREDGYWELCLTTVLPAARMSEEELADIIYHNAGVADVLPDVARKIARAILGSRTNG